MDIITALEESGLGIAVRESLWIYPTLLTLHAVGLSFLVGINVAVDLRLLGFAPGVPVPSLHKFYPVMWLGFVVNAVSGLLLIAGAANKLLYDPVFLLKMGLIVVGVGLAVAIKKQTGGTSEMAVGATGGGSRGGVGVIDAAYVVTGSAQGLALASLAIWTCAIIAGRLTAYGFFR